MRNYLIKVLWFLVVPFLFIASINYWIDNAYIFRGDETYNKIGEIIANGNNITNLANFNEFLAKKAIVNNLKKDPNVICLGTSSSMQINKSIFPESVFLNASTSNASLKEIISNYSIFYEKGISPDTIIIEVSPRLLLKRHDTLRDYYDDNYNAFMAKTKIGSLHEKSLSIAWVYELFNPVYFYENLRFGEKQFFITEEIFVEGNVWCGDGSTMYNSPIRNSSKQMILNEVEEYFERFDEDMRFATIDKELQTLFENFINYLNKKSNIVFYFPPFNPITAEQFVDKKYQIINNANAYFINFAKSNNIEIVGNYYPSEYRVPIKIMDFYDGVHPRRKVVERIFASRKLKQ